MGAAVRAVAHAVVRVAVDAASQRASLYPQGPPCWTTTGTMTAIRYCILHRLARKGCTSALISEKKAAYCMN